MFSLTENFDTLEQTMEIISKDQRENTCEFHYYKLTYNFTPNEIAFYFLNLI